MVSSARNLKRLSSQNYWNPFRDWNEVADLQEAIAPKSLKTTETLLGIETRNFSLSAWRIACLKTTETLLGIETKFTNH